MQTFYIDVSNKGLVPTLYAKQGDVGRKFTVFFTEGSVPYNIPSDVLFSAWYNGDSGEGNYTEIGDKSAFSVKGNKVEVELISQMLEIPGDGIVCIVLSKSDGGQIGSWNIPYVCEGVPGFGSKPAKEYYTAFSKAVDSLRSNPDNIVVDDTLSIPGAAADAAAVKQYVEDYVNNSPLNIDVHAEINNALSVNGLQGHGWMENNPHNVSAEQIGAATSEQVENLQGWKDATDLRLFNLNANAVKDGYILKTDGTTVEKAAHRCTGFLPVKIGDQIKYRLKAGPAYAILCFYEDVASTASSYIAGGADTKEGLFEATANGYIVACFHTSLTDGYLYKDECPDLVSTIIKEEREQTDTELLSISQKNDHTESKVFKLLTASYEKGYIATGGKKFIAQADDKHTLNTTEPLFLKAGTVVRYSLKHTTTAPIIVLYKDSNATEVVTYTEESTSETKSAIVVGSSEAKTSEYVTPADGYIRFVYHKDYVEGYAYFADKIPDYMQVCKFPDINNPNMKILLMGDSIFGNDGEIPQYLAQLTGAAVINGAFGGTRVAARADENGWKYLDGENLVASLASGNWENQEAAITELGALWMPERLANLKNLDMSTVDLLIMDWGTNDYAGGHTKKKITDAYGTVIDLLQSAFPELRILITTPIWRFFDDAEDGSKVNGDNKIFIESGGDATLKEIAETIENFAKEKRISVLNAYQNMPLSYNTASTYFDEGSTVHINAKGNKVYAHLLNGKIRTMY